ncbi:MAG: hypothetical protein R2875_04800 [Desulfobacterales bacterium]
MARKNGFDPHFGARPLDRLIQKEIKRCADRSDPFRPAEKRGQCLH